MKAVQQNQLLRIGIADNNYAFGQIMAPLRLALVGELKGPHIFDIMESIGKEETINRIQNAIKTI